MRSILSTIAVIRKPFDAGDTVCFFRKLLSSIFRKLIFSVKRVSSVKIIKNKVCMISFSVHILLTFSLFFKYISNFVKFVHTIVNAIHNRAIGEKSLWQLSFLFLSLIFNVCTNYYSCKRH